MPTLMLFQETVVAAGVPWWGAALAVVLSALLSWFLARPKQLADIHRTETDSQKNQTDTALDVLERLPGFLKRLEEAHVKSLADETTRENLQRELLKCHESRDGCHQLKSNVLVFLGSVETAMAKYDECAGLVGEIHRWQSELSRN